MTNINKPLFYNIIPNKILLSLDNVYNKDECNQLIQLSEKTGYEKASLYTDNNGIQHYNDGRDSLRCIIDDINLANDLEKRIKDIIPKIYNNMLFHSINERFRFLKYDGHGHFSRHSDAKYKTNKTISFITVLIYLNEDYEDGFTKFYSSPYDSEGFTLIPKTGMVCLMDQTIGHEVPELKSGIKYVIRTELMYEK
jgi:hypothetical protein